MKAFKACTQTTAERCADLLSALGPTCALLQAAPSCALHWQPDTSHTAWLTAAVPQVATFTMAQDKTDPEPMELEQGAANGTGTGAKQYWAGLLGQAYAETLAVEEMALGKGKRSRKAVRLPA